MEKAKKVEVIRFIIGLAIIGYSLITYLMVLIKKNALAHFVYGLLGTPYGLILLFSFVPGLYFIFTSKNRWKFDTIMGIFAVISIALTTIMTTA